MAKQDNTLYYLLGGAAALYLITRNPAPVGAAVGAAGKQRMIIEVRKNRMGTADVELKAGNMRAADEFIVYPMPDKTDKILLQSDKRWCEIDANTGNGVITNGKGGHPNRWLLSMQIAEGTAQRFIVPSDELAYLKMGIFETTGKLVGDFIKSDNSGAEYIL